MSLLVKTGFLFRCNLQKLTSLHYLRKVPARYYASDDDIDPIPDGLKTKATALSHDLPNTLFVKSYNNLGFVFSGGIQVFGPCIVFPKSVLHWNVKDAADINEDSLSLFTLLEPKLDILILGLGDRKAMSKVDPKVIVALRKLRINLEILTTDQALQTFNFLNSESRYIGGAFIPMEVEERRWDPDIIRRPDDDDPLEVGHEFWRTPRYREEDSLLKRLPRKRLESQNRDTTGEEILEELYKEPDPIPRHKK